jgi:ABC-type glycerol-3-phosphate transport system permease component
VSASSVSFDADDAPRLKGPDKKTGFVQWVMSRGVIHVFLFLLVLASVVPLVYMVSTSLKPDGTEYALPIQWIPDRFAWENYTAAFTAVPTLTFLKNTVVVTVVSLVGELLTSSLAAYAFARLRFPGRNILFVIMLSTLMLPFFVILIPLFILYRNLGWIDTLLPLTVPAFFGGSPLYIFFFRQYFLTLPRELDEAARVDGAGFFRIWWSIILPVSKPALITVAILSLVFHWNDFTGPLVILNSQRNFTLALGVRMFRDQYNTFFNQTMAFATLMTVPILIVFFVFQKHFIKGIAMTGVSGR